MQEDPVHVAQALSLPSPQFSLPDLQTELSHLWKSNGALQFVFSSIRILPAEMVSMMWLPLTLTAQHLQGSERRDSPKSPVGSDPPASGVPRGSPLSLPGIW